MAVLAMADEVLIECHENYLKGTYRNRCELLSATGNIAMSIPLKGGRDQHQPYRTTEISSAHRWQHIHYTSILSCYGSAPYFEHYIDYFRPYYDQSYRSLFDFNWQLLQLLIQLMKIDVKITFTDQHHKTAIGFTDMRQAFKPNQLHSYQASYLQVFSSDGLFDARVSSIDLLMNCGPKSIDVLKKMC